jgi:signal transduction histidine kinase
VAEEAINNAVKHSGTAEIRVEVAQDTVGITLRVSDSGKGFDPHRDYDGLGLLSIKERLRSVSGTISIVSHDGQGTCLEAVIPFLKSEIASD